MQGDERPAVDEPSPENIRAELGRILASPEFSIPERGRAFLRYVVEETLAGRAERIKAYSIAIEVFGRDEGFTQDDPVVRIEAGRLRRALERYYLVAGQTDPIHISIPKGRYVPVFTRRAQASIQLTPEQSTALKPPDAISNPRQRARRQILVSLAAVVCAASLVYWIDQLSLRSAKVSVPEGPTLAIAPFADLGEGTEAKLYALGLTEELLTELPRFKEIRVFGRETSEVLSPRAEPSRIRQELGAGYLLTGGVQVSGGRVRVTTRLVETETGATLWSQLYDDNLRSRDLFAIQSDVASKVASAVAQPYAINSQTDAQHPSQQPPDDLDAYLCTLRFYAYRAALSAELHAVVRECLERAVAHFPIYATAWAMLSSAYLDEKRFAFNPRASSPPLERALDAAHRAVLLDPGNTRALEALMTALFFDQKLAESLRVGEDALALNPNDTELMGEFGSRVAMSGQWERGEKLLEKALARNPGHSGFYHGMLALAAYMEHDYDKAVVEIGKDNMQNFPLHHLVAAIINGEAGMTAEATREGALFVKMNPSFLPNVEAELESRNIRQEDRARLIAGMRKAGLPVAPDTSAPSTSKVRQSE